MHLRSLTVVTSLAVSAALGMGAVQPAAVQAVERSYIAPADDADHAGEMWSTDDAGNFWKGTVDDKPVPRAQPTTRGNADAGRSSGGGGGWYDLVAQYDWPVETALAVIQCESHGDPNATNRYSGAAGLFQLLGWEWKARELYGPGASVYNPAVNVGTAYWIWKANGRRFGGGMGWAASYGCWS